MRPFPDPAPRPTFAPDLHPLRAAGWSIQSVTGSYVVAWRGAVEVVFVWRGGAWQQLAARSIGRAVAAARAA